MFKMNISKLGYILDCLLTFSKVYDAGYLAYTGYGRACRSEGSGDSVLTARSLHTQLHFSSFTPKCPSLFCVLVIG